MLILDEMVETEGKNCNIGRNSNCGCVHCIEGGPCRGEPSGSIWPFNLLAPSPAFFTSPQRPCKGQQPGVSSSFVGSLPPSSPSFISGCACCACSVHVAWATHSTAILIVCGIGKPCNSQKFLQRGTKLSVVP